MSWVRIPPEEANFSLGIKTSSGDLLRFVLCLVVLNVCRWGQWKDVLNACDFRKRQLGVGDVENISRTIVSNTHITASSCRTVLKRACFSGGTCTAM